jgi:tetratricopeptide (TPR) repeat protein
VKNRSWLVVLVVSLAVAVCVVVNALFGLKPERVVHREAKPLPSVQIVMVYSAVAENPTAKRVLLLGANAGDYREFLERAGLECVVGEVDGEVDIVFASGARTTKQDRFARGLLKKTGAWAECINARDMSLASFRKTLASMPGKCVHLWMPGELDWIAIGRPEDMTPNLDDMLGVFSREEAFPDLVAAKCDSLPVLFASYAGTREDIMPAFKRQDMTQSPRPEYFITKEVPKLDWMSMEGVDLDIRERVLREMRSMQIVRRIILVGVIHAEQGEEEKSIESWAKAALRSPCDTMLVERLDRLSINAQAFLKLGKTAMAARCYDTMAQIMPNDPMPVYNYGVCMRHMGELKVAELAFARAEELSRAAESQEGGE